MADVVTVKVEGLRELERAMDELTTATARGQGRKALAAGGEVLARRMRDLAPRDTGNLIENIDEGGQLTRRQKSMHRKFADIERYVGASDPAAVQTEFGNENQPPQPWARPAWDQTQDRVLKTIADTLMVGVDKAVQRARRKAMKG